MNISGQNNFSAAILGLGGIGGLLASLFWKNGFKTTCIVRQNNIDNFINAGINFQSRIFGNFISWPKFVTKLDFKPDILFITTKANELPAAIELILPDLVKNSVIIPLLNGIEHIELIRNRLGKRVAVGMIGKIESKKEGASGITHLSPNVPEIEIASDDFSPEILQDIADILRVIGMKVKILKNEKEVIWRKLARVNAVASLTALNNQPLGFIRDNPEWREKLENCVREGILVARAEGVDLDFQEIMKQINNLPASITSSLQRDIAGGKDSELEAIPGAVIRRAEHYKIPCPTIKEIYQGLLAIVKKYRN